MKPLDSAKANVWKVTASNKGGNLIVSSPWISLPVHRDQVLKNQFLK
jgi:hypothetical protein